MFRGKEGSPRRIWRISKRSIPVDSTGAEEDERCSYASSAGYDKRVGVVEAMEQRRATTSSFLRRSDVLQGGATKHVCTSGVSQKRIEGVRACVVDFVGLETRNWSRHGWIGATDQELAPARRRRKEDRS